MSVNVKELQSSPAPTSVMSELPEPRVSKNALNVLKSRYLKKDDKGEVAETPKEMYWRVAWNIAQADRLYGHTEEETLEAAKKFYNVMSKNEFTPNSPTLMNAGTSLQQLSACFVLPVEDDMDGIFSSLKNAALIHQTGGGTGFPFSRLRPKGDLVRTSGGVASGPVSFMKVFDAATEAIKQGGRRRGANMGILRVDHPDVLEFIDCKAVEGRIRNFNISVGITNAFMEAVKNDSDYDLINPRNGKTAGKQNAKEIWNKILDGAWRNGEPGVVFIDRMNEGNPSNHVEVIEATNPCGEQPLPPYDACNLGSINLGLMVKEKSDGLYEVDWDKLKETTHKAVHFLDNVIDMNNYPIPEIEQTVKNSRRIGLGIMGFADLLIKMGVSYKDERAAEIADEVMKFVEKEGAVKSNELAEKRGAYPNWEGSYWDKERNLKVRNTTITTVAPTGTISLIADCSQGVEPWFALAYVRHVKATIGQDLFETSPLFEEMTKKEGVYSEELIERLAHGESLQEMQEIPESIRNAFVVSRDIDPNEHVRIQAAFQKYVHSAVSKTINFPNQATKEDIARAYIQAWETGCKGITVYRDGSRMVQAIATKKKGEASKNLDDALKIAEEKQAEESGVNA